MLFPAVLVLNFIAICSSLPAESDKKTSKWHPFQFWKGTNFPSILEKKVDNKNSILCFPKAAKTIEMSLSVSRSVDVRRMKHKIIQFRKNAITILRNFTEMNKEFWAEDVSDEYKRYKDPPKIVKMISNSNGRKQWFYTMYIPKIKEMYKYRELAQPLDKNGGSRTVMGKQPAQTCFKYFKYQKPGVPQIRDRKYFIMGTNFKSFLIKMDTKCDC